MFITQSGVVYTAYFIDISHSFGSDSVYTFSFDAAGKTVKDDRVRVTILKILNDFFQSVRNALLVVCDSSDNRENRASNCSGNGMRRLLSRRLKKWMFRLIWEDVSFIRLCCFPRGIRKPMK